MCLLAVDPFLNQFLRGVVTFESLQELIHLLYSVGLVVRLDLLFRVVIERELDGRAYIDDGVLYMSYLLKRRSIPIEKIGKITLREDVYYVYGKDGAAAGTINAKLTSVGDVITELDKSGVNFI